MKKLIILLIMTFACLIGYGQLDTTNVGTSANSGTGEGLRSAFLKVNRAIVRLNDSTYSKGQVDNRLALKPLSKFQ